MPITNLIGTYPLSFIEHQTSCGHISLQVNLCTIHNRKHKWVLFCTQNHIKVFSKDMSCILRFLNVLYDDGLIYSAMNTARSALSAFLGMANTDQLGTHPLIVRFMKGISRSRPTLPRYECICYVKDVFNVFRQQPLVEYLSFHDLALRTVMLLALVSAQRGQSIHMMDIKHMQATSEQYIFQLHGEFKQARVGFETMNVVLPACNDDIRLCIVHTLSVYLSRSEPLRNSSQLFVSTVRPHKAVTKDTIARWIKVTLRLAGIDVARFKPHSTRAAATSAAHCKGVKVADILKVAGWSNEKTFARFYNKPLHASVGSTFSGAVLS